MTIADRQTESPQETAETAPVLLRYRLQPGHMLEYHVQMENEQHVSVDGGEPAVDHALTDSVVLHSVLKREDDLITVDSNVLSTHVTIGNTVAPAPTHNSVEFVMRSDGSVVGSEGGVPQVLFPADPVRLGESWTSQVDLLLPERADGTSESRTVDYTCTLREIGWLGERQAVVVDLDCPTQELATDGSKQTLTVAARVVFDHVAGILLQSVFETFNTMERDNTSVRAASRTIITFVTQHEAPELPAYSSEDAELEAETA